MKTKEGGVIILWYAIEAVLAILLIAVAFYFGINRFVIHRKHKDAPAETADEVNE